MCQSGWRASLGMKSTSEPTFTSASAASERCSCILISFSPALLALEHIQLHRDKSLNRASMYHICIIVLVISSQCPMTLMSL